MEAKIGDELDCTVQCIVHGGWSLKHINIEYFTPLVGIGTPPTPFPGTQGEAHSPAVEGVGEVPIPSTGEKA